MNLDKLRRGDDAEKEPFTTKKSDGEMIFPYLLYGWMAGNAGDVQMGNRLEGSGGKC